MSIEIYKRLIKLGMVLSNGTYSRYKEWQDPIQLPAGLEVDVGFDQSTKQTGIAIAPVGKPPIMLIDFINGGVPNKEIYTLLLKNYLAHLLANVKARYVIYEDPVERSNKMYTRNTLLELRGFIKTLKYSVPAFAQATFQEITVGTWRRHFLADPIYNGRKKNKDLVKQAAMEEVLVHFPEMTAYVSTYNKPPDSCDACGILMGWQQECFANADMTVLRVNHCMGKSINLTYQKEIHTCVPERVPFLLRNVFGALPSTCGYRSIQYNGEFSLEENCLRVASSFNEYIVLFVATQKDAQAIRWEHLKDVQPGEIYVVLVWRNTKSPNLPITPRPEKEWDFWQHKTDEIE